MTSTTYAFILSFLAGISTLIGFLFIYIKKGREEVLSKALGFASGVMATISITDLIPSSLTSIIKEHSIYITFLIIICGFVIGILISEFINKKVEIKVENNFKLYRLGIITMFVIILHNIPEDCSCYVSHKNIILV